MQSSLSRSLREIIQRIINQYRALFGRYQRVIIKKLTTIEKKTLVLDIDETLVFATTNRSELKIVDETIFIKMSKFGASVKAYLSYRPYLFQFLDSLRNHFELILYTCGTASYASAFAESVDKNGGLA